MSNAYDKLMSKFESWIDSLILILPNVAIAILVVIIFYFLSRYVRKIFTRILSRFSDNQAINNLLSNMITSIFLLVGLFLALGIIGLDKTVTSLLAGAGIVGLAVGLAFQDPILNIISGVIMSVKKPFNIGDTIITNGYNGVIKDITLRSTHLKTFTGEDVFIPNKSVIQSPLENFTLTNWRRVDLSCGVAYSSDLDKVQAIAIQSITDNIVYDKSKPVELIYTDFGDSSINFNLRYWLDISEEKNYSESKSLAIIALKKAFDKNDITIPFPMRTIEFSSPLSVEK